MTVSELLKKAMLVETALKTSLDLLERSIIRYEGRNQRLVALADPANEFGAAVVLIRQALELPPWVPPWRQEEQAGVADAQELADQEAFSRFFYEGLDD